MQFRFVIIRVHAVYSEKTCMRKQGSLLIFAVSLDSKFPLESCYALSSLGVQGTAPRDPVSVCRMDESMEEPKLLKGRFCNISVRS